MNASSVTIVRLEQGLTMGPAPEGNLAIPVFSRGELDVELYNPVGRDPQTPHTRDEIYFVARGSGMFFDGARRHKAPAGSFIHVPAGQEHRFEDFTEDFAVWVAFYGPESAPPVERSSE